MNDRTAADLERELAMLSSVRNRLQASDGDAVRLPTTAVDQVLDGPVHALPAEGAPPVLATLGEVPTGTGWAFGWKCDG